MQGCEACQHIDKHAIPGYWYCVKRGYRIEPHATVGNCKPEVFNPQQEQNNATQKETSEEESSQATPRRNHGEEPSLEQALDAIRMHRDFESARLVRRQIADIFAKAHHALRNGPKDADPRRLPCPPTRQHVDDRPPGPRDEGNDARPDKRRSAP